MDIDYKTVIDFSKLKTALDDRGLRYGFIAEKVEIRGDVIGRIFRNEVFPKTDLIAKICSVLKVPVSQIVEFKIESDEKKEAWFKDRVLPYSPDGEISGEVTYEPLRLMMTMYLDYINGLKDSDKTVNDLFDMIEPYRRRNGIADGTEQARKISSKNIGGKSKRKYVSKGIIPEIRTKLKHDRAVNIRTIYDICNFFGCNIDWVMSYK